MQDLLTPLASNSYSTWSLFIHPFRSLLFYFYFLFCFVLFFLPSAILFFCSLSFRRNSIVCKGECFFLVFVFCFLFFVFYFFYCHYYCFVSTSGGSTSTRSISLLFSLLFNKDRFVENARQHGAHKLDHSQNHSL